MLCMVCSYAPSGSGNLYLWTRAPFHKKSARGWRLGFVVQYSTASVTNPCAFSVLRVYEKWSTQFSVQFISFVFDAAEDVSEIDGCICDVLSFNPNDYRVSVCVFFSGLFVRACFRLRFRERARLDPLDMDAEKRIYIADRMCHISHGDVWCFFYEYGLLVMLLLLLLFVAAFRRQSLPKIL